MKTIQSAANVIFFATLIASSVGAMSAASAAATTWQQNHPRRAEVNARLAKQDRRIHNEVKSGQISKTRASALRREDRTIRREERGMASLNGGHITKVEQHGLNQQENSVSRQIGK